MLKIKHTLIAVLFTTSLAVLSSSCKKDSIIDNQETLVSGPDLNLYALTADGKLLLVNAKNPSGISSQISLSGLQGGETILGIDFRPATGQLYGIGSTSRLYIIDPKTGVSRAVSEMPFTPAIVGIAVGFDFNPTVDRIRLVTSTGQNLRLHPETGAVAFTDGSINGVTGAMITASAYAQNKAGAATTVLFGIDVANNKLHKQDPPNNGTLVEVGSLGFDVEDASGFDINPDGNYALAALSVAGTSSLFTIDLTSGKALKIGNFSQQITGIAIPTEPVAYAISASNELLIFNPLATAPVLIAKPITGIQAGEKILGLDMRPVNGQLFALGSTSRIYTINASSGAATMIGIAPLTTVLSGSAFGFDFNPIVDRIRIVSNTGQNLRVNPIGGAVIVDGNISISKASITGAAYTNNFAGTTTTALYDIDCNVDRLYKQDPPNNGVLVDVGALGINVEAANGFDIGATSGTAYGLFTVGGAQKIYTVNLTTGAATALGEIATPASAFTLGIGL